MFSQFGGIQVEWLCPVRDCTIEKLRRSSMASLRLRTALGALAVGEMGASCKFSEGANYTDSSLVMVSKIDAVSDAQRPSRWLDFLRTAASADAAIAIDYTDHHLAGNTAASAFYRQALPLADVIVCSSKQLAAYLSGHFSASIKVIEDPIEVEIIAPKKTASNDLTGIWFGHASNLQYLIDFLHSGFPKNVRTRLILMTNSVPLAPRIEEQLNHPSLQGIEVHAVPWSLTDMKAAAALADYCLLPAGVGDPRKHGASANRLLTALALGLPVAADLLPSYLPFERFFAPLRTNQFEALLMNPIAWNSQVLDGQIEIEKGYTFDAIRPGWTKLLTETLEIAKSNGR